LHINLSDEPNNALVKFLNEGENLGVSITEALSIAVMSMLMEIEGATPPRAPVVPPLVPARANDRITESLKLEHQLVKVRSISEDQSEQYQCLF
jgi:hypothetical protein